MNVFVIFFNLSKRFYMKNYRLSFAEIIIFQNNLAEVIVDDGIEINQVMVDEYHDFLLSNLVAPFSLLINKKHSYSYTFNAQKTIAHLDEILAMAVVSNTSGALMSTETLININGNVFKNIKLFEERDEALYWLKEQ